MANIERKSPLVTASFAFMGGAAALFALYHYVWPFLRDLGEILFLLIFVLLSHML